MLIEIFKNLISVFWSLLQPFIVAGVICLILFFIITAGFYIWWTKSQGIKRPPAKSRFKVAKKPNFIKKLFVQFPRQVAYDLATADVDKFGYQGMIIFTGRQGGGKTSAMTHEMLKMQEEYPLAKCITNYGFKYQNDELNHWKQLCTYSNDKYGVICGLDELQNWFNSNASKNFPPEMLAVITQNRKNKRIILGTAQSFHLISKSIRSQTTEVRECKTYLKCLTIVHRMEPELNSDGDVKKLKNLGYYFFIHDTKLREAYDTYRIIENLAKSGFQVKPNISLMINQNGD